MIPGYPWVLHYGIDSGTWYVADAKGNPILLAEQDDGAEELLGLVVRLANADAGKKPKERP